MARYTTADEGIDGWGIDRDWQPHDEEADRPAPVLNTLALAYFASDLTGGDLCLLGPAGSGKSFELKRIAATLGIDRGVQVHRLVDVFDGDPDALLDSAAGAVGPEGFLVLDGLDEAMVPHEEAARRLKGWVKRRRSGGSAQPRLVLSCRSAVWPPSLTDTLRAFPPRPDARPMTADLLPVDERSIRRAAESRGLDSGRFLDAVQAARAEPLTELPITLGLLLDRFECDGRLPETRKALFDDSLRDLLQDDPERQEDNTAPRPLLAKLEDAAERLAAAMIFSGREAVAVGRPGSGTAIQPGQLRVPDTDTLDLADTAVLRTLAGTRLFTGRDSGFGFVHRQFAEHLAGRRVAQMLPHQARSLLCVRGGVADPLRETAAAAALFDDDLAREIAVADPEVIGLSDVADDATRRVAMLGLLDAFRGGRVQTREGFGRDASTAGLRYPGVADDLSAALREPAVGRSDLQEVAISFVGGWGLAEAGDTLADLSLSPETPAALGRHAAFCLSRLDAPAARRRLRPLALTAEEVNADLRGCALACVWPEHLTAEELGEALLLPVSGDDTGFYRGFLSNLAENPLRRSADLIPLLRWASRALECESGRTDAAENPREVHHLDRFKPLISRLCLASLARTVEDAVLDALVALLRQATARHRGVFDASRGFREPEAPSDADRCLEILRSDRAVRRQILLASIGSESPSEQVPWLVHADVPGLRQPEDVEWLMDEALRLEPHAAERVAMLRVLRFFPWKGFPRCVNAWLDHLSDADVREHLGADTTTVLDSADANRQQENWYWSHPVQRDPVPLDPPTPMVVRQAVEAAEADLAAWPRLVLPALCHGTFADDHRRSTCLTSSPAWPLLEEELRVRVVASARAWVEAADAATGPPPVAGFNQEARNSHRLALHLLAGEAKHVLAGCGDQWWSRWTPFLLRTLFLRIHGEEDEPKDWLLHQMHRRAPEELRDQILAAAESEQEHQNVVQPLLRELEKAKDPALDAALRSAVADGRVAPAALFGVCVFLLRRSAESSLPVLRTRMWDEAADPPVRHRIAEALIQEAPVEAGPDVLAFVEQQPSSRREVLLRIGGGRSLLDGSAEATPPGVWSRLLEALERVYPCAEDPEHGSRVYDVSKEDEARMIRIRLVNQLVDSEHPAAPAELRRLESVVTEPYRETIGHLATIAEQKQRRGGWQPLPPERVLRLLADADLRLLRNTDDVADAVVAALAAYEDQLQRGPQPEVSDLWDWQEDGSLIPNDENRLSDKVAAAIRVYLKEHGVTAAREAEVMRKPQKNPDAAAGSIPDVWVELPPTKHRGRICVPVEVKGSWHDEVKRAMKTQLSDRYLNETGEELGVYVVGYFDAPKLLKKKKPKWPTLDLAKVALAAQADRIRAESKGKRRVVPVVLDVSRRSAAGYSGSV